jgi:hypothetical protein
LPDGQVWLIQSPEDCEGNYNFVVSIYFAGHHHR